MSQEELIKKVIGAIKNDPNRHYIKSISLFGSHLHGDDRDDSDIDLLLELNQSIGFFKLAEIQLSLEEKLGRKVDLVTKNSLSKYFRNAVIKEAKKLYEYERK